MPEPIKQPTSSLLAAEVSALVHQVELNRAGWWDRTVQRLVLAAVWLCEGTPTTDDVNGMLKSSFSLDLSRGKFDSAVGVLEAQGLIIRAPGGGLRIPDQKRTEFEKEIAAAEAGTRAAREFFFELVAKSGQAIDAVEAWDVFDEEFLTPLIRDVGANAYRLLAGERLVADAGLVDRFLKRFNAKLRPALKDLVTAFLDPKRAEVRGHVSRMLHATFCVEASGLSEEAVQRLTKAMGKQVVFRIFVDTNFLFSLLELHENPSNAAAAELQEVIAKLKTDPKVQLYVTPRTIEEAKTSLSGAKFRATGLPAGLAFTHAALRAGVSGMTERFLIERARRDGKLSANDWFDPYLNDFVPLARAKGVELFNVKLDSYAAREDVVDDIALVMRFEEKLPPRHRRKSYEKVSHDMILWHFVNDNRPALVESPIDA